jgi:hypothetical protein
VKMQIWTAVCVYVLAAVIKKELALDVLLYTFLLFYRFCPFTLSKNSSAHTPFFTLTTATAIHYLLTS